MARTPAVQDPPSGRDADILTADQFASRVPGGIHAVRRLLADGSVPGASKIGGEWRIHWPTFYAALAGPGIPAGEIVDSGRMARLLGVSRSVLRRASAAPGTPDKLPALALGAKTWWYALPAVQTQVGWPLVAAEDATPPGPPAASALPGQADAAPASPQAGAPAAPGRLPASLDHARPAPAQATAAARTLRTAGAPGRRPQPGPGRSAPSR